jgi:putative ABC transport system ATP-binding protein
MEEWPMDKLVKSKNVKRVFRQGKNEVHALRGIDLDIADGEFAILAGPSGSGKTTLLNIIGLIDALDEGSLVFEERDVSMLPERVLTDIRKRKVGFVFQNFNLVPVLSAYENVEYPLLLLKIPARERASRVKIMLERIGLWERKRHKPAQLSGGEQQRVAIARALIKQPLLVIADEPTANLDSQTTRQVIRLMRQLNEEDGVSFLIASHDPIVIEAGRRVIRMRDGQIDGHGLNGETK